MKGVGASTRKHPRRRFHSIAALRAAVAALAIVLASSYGPNPAPAQDAPPVGPSATIGALGGTREAHRVSSHPPAKAAGAAAAEEEVVLTAASPIATTAPPSATDAARAVANPVVPAAVPVAAAVETPAPVAGSKTFLINESGPPSGWMPVTPEAAPSAAPVNSAAKTDVGGGTTNASANASAPQPAAPAAANAPPAPPSADPSPGAANGSSTQVENVEPEEEPTSTMIIPSAAEQQGAQPGSQVLNYEANQQMPLNEPQLHSLQEFMNEGVNASPLGVELQEGVRRIKGGREVDGLLVVALQPGSPAERAGVQAGHRAAHDVVEGAAVAASLVFPPAVLAVPIIETMQLGENYDLIIGVDGKRVTNYMDFQDQLRDAQPGETVYLNILRGGKRLQVPVEMPKPDSSKLQP